MVRKRLLEQLLERHDDQDFEAFKRGVFGVGLFGGRGHCCCQAVRALSIPGSSLSACSASLAHLSPAAALPPAKAPPWSHEVTTLPGAIRKHGLEQLRKARGLA